MLEMAAAAAREMREHAAAGYPFEVCGFLVGTTGEESRRVSAAWPVRNAWEDDPEQRAALFAAMEQAGGAKAEGWEAASAARRYLVAPGDVLAAMKRARAERLELVGVYHTHPNHPAVPSQFDRDAAWLEWSYVILSVREGTVAEVRSWVVEDAESPFVEEPWREQ